jgi:hypothetical protein
VQGRIQLVPPSLQVIAALITYKKSLQYSVAKLEDACQVGNSYAMLRSIGWPQVKVATCNLGHGLTCAYTEIMHMKKSLHSEPFGKYRSGLVWVSELSCHPMCAFLGRICQGNLSGFQWLEKIEKKHLEWIDRVPSV